MFMDEDITSVFAQEMTNQDSLDMCAYCEPELLGTEGTGADIEAPPMTEVVKHPNVLVVIAVNDFGPGSAGTLKDLHNVCEVAHVWGGRILVVMPYSAKAWVDHALFAKI